MPYKSRKQVGKFFAMQARGEIPKGTAERWSRHTPDIKGLPERVGRNMSRAKRYLSMGKKKK